MKKRAIAFTLLLVCLLTPFAARPASAETVAAEQTPGNGCPYYIMVNRAANTVTVYGLDAAGYYTVPVRAMICSVGRAGHETPLGIFSVSVLKKEWCLMYDGTYAQYTTSFYGDILFHSVCYWAPNPAWLITEEYNVLGSPASLGCVRLQTADAKWIYDNCAPGTIVTVYDSADPGPLGKPAPLVSAITSELDNGWDPTDPRPENPWPPLLAQSFAIDGQTVYLTAGESAALRWTILPESVSFQTPSWSTGSRAVAVVSDRAVIGIGEGTTEVTGQVGSLRDSLTVVVTGNLLPLDDAVPGAWYYGDLRYVFERGMMNGTWERQFSPDMPVSCAAAVQTLYNLYVAGGGAEQGTDGEEWYSAAMDWAGEAGLTDGIGTEEFTPERALSRQELAALFYRYETVVHGSEPTERAELDGFIDATEVHPSAEDAVEWAVAAEILKGTAARALEPSSPLTRAQMAALLHRWLG